MSKLKKGKAGVDNIPGDLIIARDDDMISTFTNIYKKIWQTEE